MAVRPPAACPRSGSQDGLSHTHTHVCTHTRGSLGSAAAPKGGISPCGSEIARIPELREGSGLGASVGATSGPAPTGRAQASCAPHWACTYAHTQSCPTRNTLAHTPTCRHACTCTTEGMLAQSTRVTCTCAHKTHMHMQTRVHTQARAHARVVRGVPPGSRIEVPPGLCTLVPFWSGFKGPTEDTSACAQHPSSKVGAPRVAGLLSTVRAPGTLVVTGEATWGTRGQGGLGLGWRSPKWGIL